MLVLLWPNRSATSCAGSPCASAKVADVCRRPWNYDRRGRPRPRAAQTTLADVVHLQRLAETVICHDGTVPVTRGVNDGTLIGESCQSVDVRADEGEWSAVELVMTVDVDIHATQPRRLPGFLFLIHRASATLCARSSPSTRYLVHDAIRDQFEQKTRRGPISGLLMSWCGRGDSNPHALASASPSSWCVCQFRHFRNEGTEECARPAGANV